MYQLLRREGVGRQACNVRLEVPRMRPLVRHFWFDLSCLEMAAGVSLARRHSGNMGRSMGSLDNRH
jgi:hypothetical protein